MFNSYLINFVCVEAVNYLLSISYGASAAINRCAHQGVTHGCAGAARYEPIHTVEQLCYEPRNAVPNPAADDAHATPDAHELDADAIAWWRRERLALAWL